MLILDTYFGTHIINGSGSIIPDTANVTVSEKINDEWTLSFDIPITNRAGVGVGWTVLCEGQPYVVEHMTAEDHRYSVKCVHKFVYHAKRRHIPNIASTDSGDFIGVGPYTVISEAHKRCRVLNYAHGEPMPADSQFTYSLADAEYLAERGMTWLGGTDTPSFLIDFESVDKTTLWDVLQQVIQCAGKGEIYMDDQCYAVVERIGEDTGVIISEPSNVERLSVETDISDMVTVLYPYGKDSMEITNADANPKKFPFIISDNAFIYGWQEGYKDYDNTDPDSLLRRALWEFDEANPDRIDIPSMNISGTVDKLGITQDIAIGDSVTILKDGNAIHERIISITRYPFSGKPASVSIGRVKKDMYFYLNQIGALARRYKNISVSNGKVQGNKITGTVAKVTEAATATKADIATALRNTQGNIIIDMNGISISGQTFTVDENGNLYFGGKMVQLI